MAIIAYRLATRVHNAAEEQAVMQGLGVGAACTALLYLSLRVYSLWSGGALPMLLVNESLNWLLATELVLGALIPATLLLIPTLRRRSWVQWTAPLLMMGGVGLNRFNATLFAQQLPGVQAAPYIPHIMEWLSTLGIIAGAALAWYVFVRYFVNMRSHHAQ